LRALDLQERCDGMSSSVLYQRLRELTEAGLTEQDEYGEFTLTTLGIDLVSALRPLDGWSKTWSTKTKAKARRAQRSKA
jgi:DNA-binding HxlR family transcriptional regulator